MREINDVESQMMIIDLNIDGLLSSIVLSVFFPLPPHCLVCFLCDSLFFSLASIHFHLFIQKMTWKSRQGDVDTCRMKGKHKVRKTHTHTLKHTNTAASLLTPNIICRANVTHVFPLFLSVTHCAWQTTCNWCNCAQSLFHCLSLALPHTHRHS